MTQEIIINKFPLIIFTDCHNNIENVKKLISLYPSNQIISLGDITNLYKTNDVNNKTIQFFIDNKIPTLIGNHEQYILLSKIKEKYTDKYFNYFKNLPVGFKLILPDNTNYFCYHNRPLDLWSFTEKNTLNEKEFIETYHPDKNTNGIIIGHNHQRFIINYTCNKLISIGSLKDGYYGVLDKEGVKFNQL